MRVFVTGATGVVGRRVVPLLIDHGHEVKAAARSAVAARRIEAWGAAAINVSLFGRTSLVEALRGCHAVINLATHMPRSPLAMMLPWSWRENDQLRSRAAPVLVWAADEAGCELFVQESFAPAYPSRGDRWIEETVPLAPSSYNGTIRDAESAALGFQGGGRRAVVLRYGVFYGEDARQTAELIAWIRRGWAPIPGASEAFISSVSHDDSARATVTALQLLPGVYNVVDDEPLSHRAYVDGLADALGIPRPRPPPPWSRVLFGPVGEMLSRSLRISNRKIRDGSGWTPAHRNAVEGFRVVLRRDASSATPP